MNDYLIEDYKTEDMYATYISLSTLVSTLVSAFESSGFAHTTLKKPPLDNSSTNYLFVGYGISGCVSIFFSEMYMTISSPYPSTHEQIDAVAQLLLKLPMFKKAQEEIKSVKSQN